MVAAAFSGLKLIRTNRILWCVVRSVIGYARTCSLTAILIPYEDVFYFFVFFFFFLDCSFNAVCRKKNLYTLRDRYLVISDSCCPSGRNKNVFYEFQKSPQGEFFTYKLLLYTVDINKCNNMVSLKSIIFLNFNIQGVALKMEHAA